MKEPIQIREYGGLCTSKGFDGYKYLPESTFKKLEQFILENKESETEPIELMGISARKGIGKVITAKNYVGMIAMKDGTVIEILPKICSDNDESGAQAKKILIKMLNTLRNSPFKNFQTSSLDTSKLNVFEIFVRMFSQEIYKIVKYGLRLEGHCTYKLLGTDKLILIADQFKSGGYFMQETTDMIHFTQVDRNEYSLNHLKPRHGSMLHITEEEYDRLIEYYSIA